MGVQVNGSLWSCPYNARLIDSHIKACRRRRYSRGEPEVVTIDKSGANTAALATFNTDKPDEENITVRQSNYLNILGEQDERNIKRRIRQMMRLKSFRRARAQTLLAGSELIHMIRKVIDCPPQNNFICYSPGQQHHFCCFAVANATQPTLRRMSSFIVICSNFWEWNQEYHP